MDTVASSKKEGPATKLLQPVSWKKPRGRSLRNVQSTAMDDELLLVAKVSPSCVLVSSKQSYVSESDVAGYSSTIVALS